MKGCRRGKTFCTFKQCLVIRKNKGRLLMGKIGTNLHRFFPPKDLVYFWLIIRRHFKAQTFFPPKDLVYFLVFTWLLLKAQNFPVKRLRIFLSKPKLDFNSNFSCQTTMIIFLRWKSNSKHRLFFLVRIIFSAVICNRPG